MGAYDPQGREIVLALARVLRHAGVTFGVLRKEKCTGDPARRLGNDLAFSQVAEANIETLRAAAWARWSPSARTACAPSERTGGNSAPPSRSSITANFWPACARLPAADGAARETVVFHDPCYLGRYRNIYDEPRAAIARVRRRGGPAARTRTFLLLRRGRRPDVSRRGERRARQPGRAPTSWRPPERRSSAPPALFARACSATRWEP